MLQKQFRDNWNMCLLSRASNLIALFLSFRYRPSVTADTLYIMSCHMKAIRDIELKLCYLCTKYSLLQDKQTAELPTLLLLIESCFKLNILKT